MRGKSRTKINDNRLEINVEYLTKLASIGCTVAEIADFLGCSSDTLCTRYGKESREDG